MLKSIWIIAVALLMGTVCAPKALADSYIDGTINLTITGGGPAPSAANFVYDSTTNSFTDFMIDWDGVVWNFRYDGYFLSQFGTSGSWCAETFPVGPSQCFPLAFDFFPAGGDGIGAAPEGYDFTVENAFVLGTYTVTFATPEPNTLSFILLGLGGLLLMAFAKSARRSWKAGFPFHLKRHFTLTITAFPRILQNGAERAAVTTGFRQI